MKAKKKITGKIRQAFSASHGMTFGEIPEKVGRKVAPPAADMSFLKATAEKIPAQITGGNFGETRGESRFSPGRWVMRNGSIAVIVEPVTLKFGVGGRQTWQGWKGHLDGHPDGEGLVWGLDGKRSDATPQHEHDLLQRAKIQKVKK